MCRYSLCVRTVFVAALILAPVALFAQNAPAVPVPAALDEKPNATGTDITPDAAAAIDRGLEFLARTQSPDGSFPLGGLGGRGAEAGDVGITGLAGIAFLANGSTPNRGKYGQNVQRCMEFILKNTNMTTGYINSNNSRMYQHGFAMLFLAEVFGAASDNKKIVSGTKEMTENEMVRSALNQAVQLLKRCQSPAGGWRYEPTQCGDDISLTICQMMALRAARNAGIAVNPDMIKNGVNYVISCYNPNGQFTYQPKGSFVGSGFSSTAAGVCTLYYAGKYDSKEAKTGATWLANNLNLAFQGNTYAMYGNYYAVQAMHQAPNRENTWNKYFPFARKELVSKQRSDGSWVYDQGPHYSTAMALIILQVPNEYLPILQH